MFFSSTLWFIHVYVGTCIIFEDWKYTLSMTLNNFKTHNSIILQGWSCSCFNSYSLLVRPPYIYRGGILFSSFFLFIVRPFYKGSTIVFVDFHSIYSFYYFYFYYSSSYHFLFINLPSIQPKLLISSISTGCHWKDLCSMQCSVKFQQGDSNILWITTKNRFYPFNWLWKNYSTLWIHFFIFRILLSRVTNNDKIMKLQGVPKKR